MSEEMKESKTQREGLEGQLKDVEYGDIILLRSEKYNSEITGYFWGTDNGSFLGRERVLISIKSPCNNPSKKLKISSFLALQPVHFQFGTEPYLLKEFSEYKILKKHDPRIKRLK